MDVNTICGARGVQIREVPQGTSMPESAAPTAQDIAALGEIDWALQSLGQFVDLRASIMVRLGRANQSGGITNHAWEVWGQVSQRLSSETATTASALPLENLISGVVTALEAEASVQNDGDLVILRGILEEYEPFLTGFQNALTDGNHPIAAGVTYDSAKSFKYNIRRIVNQIHGRISEGIREGLGYDNQTFWNASALNVDSVQALLGVVRTQTEQACNDYNDLVPDPPAPPIIAPPVTPQPERGLVGYGIHLVPVNAFQVAGDNTSDIQSGPGLQGEAGLALHFEDFSLQLNYRALLGMNSFSPWTSDVSYDSGVLSFIWNDLRVQGTYLWQRDFNNDRQAHLGAAGLGYRFLDGLLEPFGHFIIGRGDDLTIGGAVGVRSSHEFEDPSITISGQVLYNIINQSELSHRIGGSAAVIWSPVSFGGADLEIGAQVSAMYSSTPAGANVVPGVFVGWNGDIVPSYPVIQY